MIKIDLSALKKDIPSQENNLGIKEVVVWINNNSIPIEKDSVKEDIKVQENNPNIWTNSNIPKISLFWIQTPEKISSVKIESENKNTVIEEKKDSNINPIKISIPIEKIENRDESKKETEIKIEIKQESQLIKEIPDITNIPIVEAVSKEKNDIWDSHVSESSELFWNYKSDYKWISIESKWENIWKESENNEVWDITENTKWKKIIFSKKIIISLGLLLSSIILIFWYFQIFNIKTSVIDINNIKKDTIKVENREKDTIIDTTNTTNNDNWISNEDRIKLKIIQHFIK